MVLERQVLKARLIGAAVTEALASAVGFRSSAFIGRRNIELKTLPFGVSEVSRVAPSRAWNSRSLR